MTSKQLRSFLWRKSLLVNRKRYHGGHVRLNGTQFRYIDWPSFVHQYHDILVRNIYKIPESSKVRTILDCGVNVGVSMAYFLTQYPNSFVYGWEADSTIAKVASANLAHFSQDRFILDSKAVWTENGRVNFCADKADAGSVVLGTSTKRTVAAMRLRDQLQRHEEVDLLKMDIEGAEFAVLQDCAAELGRVKNLFVEIHLNDQLTPRLPALLDCMRESGFRVRAEAVGTLGYSPFCSGDNEGSFDSQMNLFCTRNDF